MIRLGTIGWDEILERLKTNQEQLDNGPSLNTLNLSGVRSITNREFEPLCKALKVNLNLMKLHFDCEDYRLGDDSHKGLISLIEEGLHTHPSITILDLKNNHITDTGVQYLAKLLEKNRSLLSIDLSNNPIGPQGVGKLMQVLADCNYTVIEIKLSGCSFSESQEVCYQRLCSYLDRNKKLMEGLHTTVERRDLYSDEIAIARLENYHKQGASLLSVKDSRENTLLHLAISGGESRIKTAKWIVDTIVQEQGMFLDRKNASGDTALDLAKISRQGGTSAFVKIIERAIKPGTTAWKEILDQIRENDKNRTFLEIRAAQFDDTAAKHLANQLIGNTSLKKLDIRNTNLTDEGVKIFIRRFKENTEEFEKNTSLNYVCIGNSNGKRSLLTNESAKLFSEFLTIKNNNLTKLILCGNNFDGKGAKFISKALLNNNTLKLLDLSSNEIGDKGATAIGQALEKNEVLQSLNLADNEISEEGVCEIGNALRVNKALSSLSLARNSLNRKSIQSLLKGIKDNSILTELNVDECFQMGTMVDDIAKLLTINHSLSRLSLASTKIKDKDVVILAGALIINQTLESLNLCENQITDEGADRLIKLLEENHSLTVIDLEKNIISKDKLAKIYERLESNQQIKNQLHQAAKDSNSLLQVQEQVAKGASLLSITKDYNTPLHWAILSGNQAIAKWLIETMSNKGIPLNKPNKAGQTALSLAIERRYIDLVNLLEKEKYDNFSVNLNNNQPLTQPFSNQKISNMHKAEKLASPTQTISSQVEDRSIPKPFHPIVGNIHSVEAYLAEVESHWPVEFRALLAVLEPTDSQPLLTYIKERREALKTNAKAFREEFQYLLLCTAYYGSLAQVEALMKATPANVLTGVHGLTVLHMAALKGDGRLVQWCETRNFSLDTPAQIGPYSNMLPMHCAIIAGHQALVEALIPKQQPSQVGYDYRYEANKAHEKDELELNWLSLAVYAGQESIVYSLLRYEALLTEISAVNSQWGGNILHMAVESFRHEVLQALLSHAYFRSQTLLEGTNTNGLTPFALAAKLGNLPAMLTLRDKGALIDKPAKSGKYQNYRPLQLAEESADLEAVRLLLHWGVNAHQVCHVKLGATIEELTPAQLAGKRAAELQQELDNEKVNVFELQDAYTQQVTAYTAIKHIITAHINNHQLTQFNETTAKKVTYKNLVFKGGGPKGIVYVGALVKLVELWAQNPTLQDLKTIERVGGTSAGAITAVLLALGYTPKVIDELLRKPENQPKQFLEGQPLGFLSSKPASKKLLEAAASAGWYALHPLQLGNLFINLAKEESLCSGDVFLQWMEGHIKAATGKAWCTFGELKELIDSQPERKYRHLHVVTLQVNPATQIEVLSSEDPRYKDYTIAHAIRASMSIPVVFKPAQLHKLFLDAHGQRSTVPASEAHYIDGGVLANYPLKLFDKARFVYQSLYSFRDERSKDFPIYNEATLGFYIEPEQSMQAPTYQEGAGKISMWKAVEALYASAQDRTHTFDQNERRSIAIGNAGVSLFDFELNEKQLEDLYEVGVKAVAASPWVQLGASIEKELVKASAAKLASEVGLRSGSPIIHFGLFGAKQAPFSNFLSGNLIFKKEEVGINMPENLAKSSEFVEIMKQKINAGVNSNSDLQVFVEKLMTPNLSDKLTTFYMQQIEKLTTSVPNPDVKEYLNWVEKNRERLSTLPQANIIEKTVDLYLEKQVADLEIYEKNIGASGDLPKFNFNSKKDGNRQYQEIQSYPSPQTSTLRPAANEAPVPAESRTDQPVRFAPSWMFNKQEFFRYNNDYNYDKDTQEEIKAIFKKYYQVLFEASKDNLFDISKEFLSNYQQVLAELESLNEDELEKLNETLQKEPELLLHLKNMPLCPNLR